MFRIDPKETILKQDDKLKIIELCIYCDRLNKFTEKWDEKEYSVSHCICEDCKREYLD